MSRPNNLSKRAAIISKGMLRRLRFSSGHNLSTEHSSQSPDLDFPWPSLKSIDPCNYTGGRWLHRDHEQREARRVDFNLQELFRRAIDVCPGATRVADAVKHEGGFNKVFEITMNNGAKVIARLPTRVAGPVDLVTHSEVATLSYLAKMTKVPVPKILQWSASSSDPVGAEYILMESMQGTSLVHKWHSMTPAQHIELIASIRPLMKEMGTLSFPGFGSIYFADAPFPTTLGIELPEGFQIGPHCSTAYWDCVVGDKKYYHWRSPNRGPWSSLEEFSSGLIDSAYSRIPPADDKTKPRLPYLGSVEASLELLQQSTKMIEALIQSAPLQAASEPLFWHPDFNMRNIFVDETDPTQITGIIDWQSAGISPAFMYALETPDFAEELPYDEDLDGRDKSPDEETQLAREDADRCSVAFAVCAEVTPKFRTAKNLAPSIARPLIFCDALWRNGTAMLRQELLDLSKNWHQLGLPNDCPYQASKDEEDMQEQHFEDFKSVQRLKSFLARAFHGNTDGWIPSSEYDEARQQVEELYQSWLTSATSDGDMTRSKAEAMWPWTVR